MLKSVAGSNQSRWQRVEVVRLASAAMLVVVAVGVQSPLVADEPLAIGTEAQVFVDDYVIESMSGLKRRLNPLVKHPGNPIIKPDQPWEENYALPLSVFYDEEQQLFRMWYRPGQGKFNMGYVTSPDGITWDKPALGLVDYKGSKANSQIALKTGPFWNGVLKDERDADPARRYKLLAYNRATDSNGIYLFVSPDGLTWSPHSDKPLLEGLADCHTFMGWDANINRYVAYVRPDKVIRTIGRTTSEDLIHFTPPQVVLEPDDDDPPGTQFYGMSVYPDRGVYYGLLWVYHPNQLMIDVQLTFSRDGIQWQRAGRRHPILSYGLPNQFDSHYVLAMQPIRRGDELKVFYFAIDRPHPVVYPNEAFPPLKAPPPRTEQTWLKDRQGCTGLATCLRDRFVSLDGDGKSNELITRAFKVEGRELRLNADARGDIQVEVRDENGKPLPGFTAAECTPVKGDSVQASVSWRNQKDLAGLQGKTVKLRFKIRVARLFSFQLVP